jgi:hypothetical protein
MHVAGRGKGKGNGKRGVALNTVSSKIILVMSAPRKDRREERGSERRGGWLNPSKIGRDVNVGNKGIGKEHGSTGNNGNKDVSIRMGKTLIHVTLWAGGHKTGVLRRNGRRKEREVGEESDLRLFTFNEKTIKELVFLTGGFEHVICERVL